MRPELEGLARYGGGAVLWAAETPVLQCHVLYSGVLRVQVDWDRLEPGYRAVTNERVWRYNSEAARALQHSGVRLWQSLHGLAEGTLDDMTDGFHLAPLALARATQMVLNFVCNDNMNFNDGSCCKSSDHPTSLQVQCLTQLRMGAIAFCCAQVVALGVLAGALGLSLLVGLYELCKTQPSHQYQTNRCQLLPRPGQLIDCNLPSNSVTSFLFCLARLAVIIAYFYTCDRTNFFMKENKYFTPINFWLPVLYVTVLGIFFNEESSYTVRSPLRTCRNFLVKFYSGDFAPRPDG